MTKDQKAVAIGASSGIATMIVALVALSNLIPGIAADATAGERLAYAFQWIALAALPLALAIASVGNARFNSEAIDPTAGKECAELIVNGRVVDNTVQQYLLFGAASLAVAAGARGDQLGIVAARQSSSSSPAWCSGSAIGSSRSTAPPASPRPST